MKDDNKTTKDKLIYTAVTVMAEKGVDLFATKSVAERAGVSESLLYKYFGTRGNFIRICYSTMLEQYCERIKTLSSLWHEGMSLSSSKDLWNAYIDILLENKDRTVFMFDYVLSPRADQEAVRDTGNKLLALNLNRKIRYSHPDLTDEMYIFRREAARIIGIGYAMSVIRSRFSDTEEMREMLWDTVRGCVQ